MTFFARNETVGDGVGDTVAVPFPYLSQSHIHVLLDGVQLGDETLTWLDPSLIQLESPPGVDVEVVVLRDTPIVTPIVVFKPGVFTASDLNDSALSLLYAMQEVHDRVSIGETTIEDSLGAIEDISETLATIQQLALDIEEDKVAIEALVAQIEDLLEGAAASAVSYDNATSGATADDVQEALDEAFEELDLFQGQLGVKVDGPVAAVTGRIALFDGTSGKLIKVGSEGILATVGQAEAEAGTETARRIWTAERVKQAVTAAGGVVVQHVYVEDGEVATGGTVIPLDDTIPQQTEGDEYMTGVITPKNANNILAVRVTALLSNSVADNYLTGALFRDSGADAIAAVVHFQSGATGMVTMSFTKALAAGSVATTTLKFRAGRSGSGTVTFNGRGGSRLYGGVAVSSIEIIEYKV
jgi:hypothetical protein